MGKSRRKFIKLFSVIVAGLSFRRIALAQIIPMGFWKREPVPTPTPAHPSAPSTATLWSWGFDNNYSLGGGTTRSSPVQVGTATNWETVYAGNGDNGFGLKDTGILWAWGGNSSGSLGDGSATPRNAPVNTGVYGVQIGVGAIHTIGQATDYSM